MSIQHPKIILPQLIGYNRITSIQSSCGISMCESKTIRTTSYTILFNFSYKQNYYTDVLSIGNIIIVSNFCHKHDYYVPNG